YAGSVVLVHEVFAGLGESEKDFVRSYATLAARGEPRERILSALASAARDREPLDRTLHAARRQVRSLDSTVLFSPDGALRVQLGSLSRSTKALLREGLQGEQLLILPATLFEDQTNYADIEFLVYLNFFLRQRARTRIAGTTHQRDLLRRLL